MANLHKEPFEGLDDVAWFVGVSSNTVVSKSKGKDQVLFKLELKSALQGSYDRTSTAFVSVHPFNARHL